MASMPLEVAAEQRAEARRILQRRRMGPIRTRSCLFDELATSLGTDLVFA